MWSTHCTTRSHQNWNSISLPLHNSRCQWRIKSQVAELSLLHTQFHQIDATMAEDGKFYAKIYRRSTEWYPSIFTQTPHSSSGGQLVWSEVVDGSWSVSWNLLDDYAKLISCQIPRAFSGEKTDERSKFSGIEMCVIPITIQVSIRTRKTVNQLFYIRPAIEFGSSSFVVGLGIVQWQCVYGAISALHFALKLSQ